MFTGSARRAHAVGIAALFLVLALPAGAGAAVDPLKISFDEPVAVTQNRAFQAAEPSMRVDAPDPTHRIWVAAPSGIGINSRSLPAPGSENSVCSGTPTTTGRRGDSSPGPQESEARR